MTRKTILIFVAISIGSMLLFTLFPDGGKSALFMITVPFTLIGNGLRQLSLSGTVGNAAAVVLYTGLCLSPMLLPLKRKWKSEDWLLVLASAALFYVMYLMINPGLMPTHMQSQVGRIIYSGTVISIFVSWGLLKLLQAGKTVRQKSIYKALRILLMVCAAECIVLGFGAGFANFLDARNNLYETNTMLGINLTPTSIFLFADFAATALEYGLDALVMLWGVKLLFALEQDPYSEDCCAIAEKISTLCRNVLVTITMVSLALNVAQVLFASELYSVDVLLRIPVFSMALVFGCMALTRLLSQGRELKEDNDLFI